MLPLADGGGTTVSLALPPGALVRALVGRAGADPLALKDAGGIRPRALKLALADKGGAAKLLVSLALADGGGATEPLALKDTGGEPRALTLALADGGGAAELLLKAVANEPTSCFRPTDTRCGTGGESRWCVLLA